MNTRSFLLPVGFLLFLPLSPAAMSAQSSGLPGPIEASSAFPTQGELLNGPTFSSRTQALSPFSNLPTAQEGTDDIMLRALTGAAIGAGVGYLVGCATEENCDRNTNWALGGWDEICISRKVTTVIGLGVGLVLGAATAKRSKSYQGEILSLRTISVVPAPALPGPGRAGFAFSVVVRR